MTPAVKQELSTEGKKNLCDYSKCVPVVRKKDLRGSIIISRMSMRRSLAVF